MYEMGNVVWDRWTHESVQVLAGAQSANMRTVQFPNGDIAVIALRHLGTFLP